MSLNKDSLLNTFLVATVLCLVCSALVSVAAVGLKPIQDRNVQLDRKKNILQVTGFTAEEIESAGGVNELFEKRFTAIIIDLDSGEEAAEQCQTDLEEAGKSVGDDVVASYDQVWASKSKKKTISDAMSKAENTIGVKYREKYSHVYLLNSADGTSIEKFVFPVRGYGLWSMMKGYLAVEADLQTVAGLTFYDQKETPGLGGEVTNSRWKQKWSSKQIFKDGQVALRVSKGDQTNNEYGVDGLTGATITSNGVTKLIAFWMGPKGFGPYIEANQSGAASDNSSQSGDTNG